MVTALASAAGGIAVWLGLALFAPAGTQGPLFGSSVPPEALPVARAALGALQGGPEWNVVVRCETPWETALRLRPFIDGIEVRGADCLLHLERSGGTGLPRWANEADPASIDWARMRRDVERWRSWAASGGRTGSSGKTGSGGRSGSSGSNAADGSAGSLRRPGADEPAAVALLNTVAAALLGNSADKSRGTARVLVRLSPDRAQGGLGRGENGGAPAGANVGANGPDTHALTPWIFASELSLDDPSWSATAHDLPWDGDPPPSGDPPVLEVEMDPETFGITAVRDLRLSFGAPAVPPLAVASSASWTPPTSTPAAASTTTGYGLLFDPNPVVTSANRSLRSGDPVDAYRVWCALPLLDGSGALTGSLVRVTTGLPPAAREPGSLFVYPAASPHFTEAMAYLHATRALARPDSLGFSGLFPAPVTVKAHGTGQDNSWYSRIERTVVMGDGGVPDAEDADIILHEMGHVIHDALVPGFGQGSTMALSEGFSDFWAASLTGEPCIGDWDATVYSPPCLRSADSPATWPASLTGRSHVDGGIYSGALWEIRDALGARAAETLALAAFLEQGTATTFPEAGQSLVRAAERIGRASDLPVISAILARRGLIPRDLDVTMSAGDEQTIPLGSPGYFLGRPVRALVLNGEGTMYFLAAEPKTAGGQEESGENLSFPAGPPAVFPCAPRSGSFTVRWSGTIDADGARLAQQWERGGEILARARIDWNPIDGSCEWTYELLPADPLFRAGAGLGGVAEDSLASISLFEVPAEGLSPLHGFVGFFTDEMSRRTPLRYRLSGGIADAGFRLSQLSAYGAPGGLSVFADPNPFRESVTLRIFQKRPGRTTVAVFDFLGRRVRVLEDGALSCGAHAIAWDGKDQGGRSVSSGIYWARIRLDGSEGSVRLLRIR